MALVLNIINFILNYGLICVVVVEFLGKLSWNFAKTK